MSAIQFGEVEKVRLQLRALVLPKPAAVIDESFATASHECCGLSGSVESDPLAALTRASAGLPIDSPELRALIRRAMAQWSDDCLDSAPSLPLQAGLDADPHDSYFRIERIEAIDVGDSLSRRHYLRALIVALDLFLREVASPDELEEYQCIGVALLDLWLAAFGGARLQEPASKPGTMHQRAPSPVRRWVHGHQIFAVVTQGLIWTLHRFERAMQDDDAAALRESLQRMAQLYRASAAAFRFTADFEPAFYEHSIRPSMSEPPMPSGFSGTMSTDHGHLVSRLKVLRAPLAAARARCPLDYDAMTQALSQVYEDHKWVCARFTGAASTSLLTGSLSGDRSAVEMLDRFKARRVGNLLA